jgi:hypothetical protein
MAAMLVARCSTVTGCRHRSQMAAAGLAVLNDASRERAASTALAAVRAYKPERSLTGLFVSMTLGLCESLQSWDFKEDQEATMLTRKTLDIFDLGRTASTFNLRTRKHSLRRGMRGLP